MFAYMLLVDTFILIHAAQECKVPVYLGCVMDDNNRTLQEMLYASKNYNTRDKCIQECFSAGYKFSGTEYGTECWCGNTLTSYREVSESECVMRCSGNAFEYCGADWRLSLYYIPQSTLTTKGQTEVEISSPISVDPSTFTTTHESVSNSKATPTLLSSTGLITKVTTADASLEKDVGKDPELGCHGTTQSVIIGVVLGFADVILFVYAVFTTLLIRRYRTSKDDSENRDRNQRNDQGQIYENEPFMIGAGLAEEGPKKPATVRVPESEYTSLDAKTKDDRTTYDIIRAM